MTQELDPIAKNMFATIATVVLLAAQCTEFALQMAEAGHGEKVRSMITKLNNLSGAVGSGDLDRVREDIVSLMAEMEALRMFCQKEADRAIRQKTEVL